MINRLDKAKRQRKLAAKAFDTEIGLRILKRRLANNMSQSDLASKIGYSAAQLSKYESGTTTCEPYTLALISEVLGCKASDFVDGIEA